MKIIACCLWTTILAGCIHFGDDKRETEALRAATIKLNGSESTTDREALAKVTVDEARAAALAHTPGEVKEVELEAENGYLVYSVDIVKGGKKHEVQVDAGTGKVLYDETDDEEHDGEHD